MNAVCHSCMELPGMGSLRFMAGSGSQPLTTGTGGATVLHVDVPCGLSSSAGGQHNRLRLAVLLLAFVPQSESLALLC